MSKKKKQKNKFPRGEYRAKWDMPHDLDKAYKRSNVKKELQEALSEHSAAELENDEELEEEEYWFHYMKGGRTEISVN